MRAPSILSLLALSVFLTGCEESAPRLALHLPDRSPDLVHDWFPDADVIVIGTVSSHQFVGPIVQSLRLVKVILTVENVLQGTVGTTEEPLIFYYYGNYLKGAGPYLNGVADHGRYVFFLKPDGGVLRAAWDVWESNIEVTSGRHDALPLSPKDPLPERLAVLLMTPGADLNPNRFGSRLDRTVTFAQPHLGSWRTVKLLTLLLKRPERALRVGACEELTMDFHQSSCWADLDAGDGDELLHRSHVSRRTRRLHLAEARDPVHWWESRERDFNYPQKRLDDLKLLTIDDDQLVRQNACAFLKTNLPDAVADSGCIVQ